MPTLHWIGKDKITNYHFVCSSVVYTHLITTCNSASLNSFWLFTKQLQQSFHIIFIELLYHLSKIKKAVGKDSLESI